LLGRRRIDEAKNQQQQRAIQIFLTYETNKLRNCWILPQNANNNNWSNGKIDFQYFIFWFDSLSRNFPRLVYG
jgi:hypothetical protein